MALNTQAKQEIINTHQTHGTDTGSAEVQIAMLSKRIDQLSKHLQGNSHDYSSRQGLLKIINLLAKNILIKISQPKFIVL